MPKVLAQCVLPRNNAIPADASVNTFWFNAPGDFSGQSTQDAIVASLNAFYLAIGGFISPVVPRSGPRVKLYDMIGPPPHPPVEDQPLTIAASSGQALPSEVAVCLSLEAAILPGLNRARRRGRVFIGPLDGSANQPVSSEPRPGVSVSNALRDAAQGLKLDMQALAPWSIFSRSSGLMVPVDHGWIDNAFDTIRSRGPKATIRTLWP